jgi:glycosyltransferase involved in cell wall biosynthesis
MTTLSMQNAVHRTVATAADRRPEEGLPSVTYVSWAESCSRSDHTARELGGCSHMVYASRLGSHPATVVIKYAVQWVRTARILRREKPDAVFVMTPPPFAALPALLYAWWQAKTFVLDAHTAAFLHPRWRRFQWLQRWLCRHAATTLVHNEYLADRVRAMGAHVTLVPDVPIVYSHPEVFPRPPGLVVAAVCSFNPDEPVGELLAAAQQLPEVHFFVTGNPLHFPREFSDQLPPNVRLTGFLSTEAYGGLLSAADVVLALTTRDHTMLRGAYEAIYQGTPVIVSDWQLLRTAFPEGAIHVDNTAPAIASAVRSLAADPQRYRAEASRQRQAMLKRWASTRAAILQQITPRSELHPVGGSRGDRRD